MRIRGSSDPGKWRVGVPEIPISSAGVMKKEISEVTTSSANSEQSLSFSGGFSARCKGLDLLTMAVGHVSGRDILIGSSAGSVFWVPFVQRKIVRRAKRALWLQKESQMRSEAAKEEEKKKEIALQEDIFISKKQKQKRRSLLRYRSRDPLKTPAKVQSFLHKPGSCASQLLDGA